MHTSIRHFRNSDAPQICKIWNNAYRAFGDGSAITQQSLELCVLGKPYFSAETFFVAVRDDELAGFAHVSFAPADELTCMSSDEAVLSALCVDRSAEEQTTAELITAVTDWGQRVGVKRIEAMPRLPKSSFYIGLGPGDSMMGVVDEEPRLQGCLSAAGFERTAKTALWELELAHFHAPIDRQQIQIRRSAQVQRSPDERTLPWWLACSLGHAEQFVFQLALRGQSELTCDTILWTIDHCLVAATEQVARLWWPGSFGNAPVEYQLFLLTECFRQLAIERFETIRVVTLVDEPIEPLLRKLGFQMRRTGWLMAKSF